MTNAEKFLKDGVSVEELARKIDQYCYDNETPDEDTGLSTEELVTMFLEEEIKPALTEDERIKEMVYTTERKREVLATGYYFGLLYYVLSLGTNPTAYVKIPKDNWLCTVENYDDIPIECHGGVTFRDDHLYIADNQEIEGEFIGWDYAHCTDYAPYYDEVLSKDTHKWTTKEILEEVKEVCSQIVELGKKPHLTEDERVILKNVGTDYQSIERDDECLWVRGVDKDGFMATCYFKCFDHLFQFIKERRRIFY